MCATFVRYKLRCHSTGCTTRCTGYAVAGTETRTVDVTFDKAGKLEVTAGELADTHMDKDGCCENEGHVVCDG
jgi:hypothetical protein